MSAGERGDGKPVLQTFMTESSGQCSVYSLERDVEFNCLGVELASLAREDLGALRPTKHICTHHSINEAMN
jgi:hypothetical protein